MTFDAYRKCKYIPELDGLRALSVLMVVTCHMHDREVWRGFSGQLGVVVFFVISGYLITTLCLREEAERGLLSLRAFFVRRCFRILPAYYFVLALYCVLILILGVHAHTDKRDVLLRALPYYLSYVQEIPFFAWHGLPSYQPFYQSWSLGIEEKFYLVWPALAFLALAHKKWARTATTASLACVIFLLPFVHPSLGSAMIYPYFHILVGCFLAVLLNERRWFERVSSAAGKPWLYGAVLFAIILQLSIARFTPTSAAYVLLESAYSLSIATVIGLMVCGTSALQRVLSTRPLIFVGKISYGIYLVHELCLNAVEKVVLRGTGKVWVSVLAYVAAASFSIGVAYLLWRAIEKPLIQVGRNWSHRILVSQPANWRPANAVVPHRGELVAPQREGQTA